MLRWQQAGKHGGVRGQSPGGRRYGALEKYALLGDLVYIGRCFPEIPIAREVVGPRCVKADEDDIWKSIGVLKESLPKDERRRDKRNQSSAEYSKT